DLLSTVEEAPYSNTFTFEVKTNLKMSYKTALIQLFEASILFYFTRDNQSTENYTEEYTYFSIGSDVRNWLVMMAHVSDGKIHFFHSGIKQWEELNHCIIRILFYLSQLNLRASAGTKDYIFHDTHCLMMHVEAGD